MIEVNELCKSYGDRDAIDNLSFNVKKGEVVGFLGPNGAGKTTTMKIITGYMAPTSGTVSVGGFDVFENPIEVKKQIGYLPETPPVYLDMYVRSYLEFVAELKGVSRDQLKSQVDLAIEKTNLEDVAGRMIQNLSKGFRQRVGLAQALVSSPDILILDEPTVGLDPKQVAEIRELIGQLKGEHTIVLSTHILPEVQATCERIIIINEGVIVAEDSIGDLSRRLSGGRVLKFRVRRNGEEVAKAIQSLGGVQGVNHTENLLEVQSDDSEATIDSVLQQVLKSNAGLIDFESEMALEDIFIQLTSNQKAKSQEALP